MGFHSWRELMIDAVLVKNANRMMTVATLLEHGIELSFADGAKGPHTIRRSS